MKKNSDFIEDQIVEVSLFCRNVEDSISHSPPLLNNNNRVGVPLYSPRRHRKEGGFPWGTVSPYLIQHYFQPQPNVDTSYLKMTNISLYSTTPWKEANFISRAIVNFYTEKGGMGGEKPPVVTDATANVGGNTISFHLSGIKTVNCVEIDKKTCEMLKNNLNTYHLPTDNVYCCDYLQIYKNLKQDVVFLDPPWGGRDYKKANILDLYLGETNIIDLCVELMGVGDSQGNPSPPLATLIVLKLPINYNLPELIKKMPNKSFLTQKIYRQNRHSYNVIFCF